MTSTNKALRERIAALEAQSQDRLDHFELMKAYAAALEAERDRLREAWDYVVISFNRMVAERNTDTDIVAMLDALFDKWDAAIEKARSLEAVPS